MSAQEWNEEKTDTRKGPVSSGMDDISKGLEELNRLLLVLRSRLSPVRRDAPMENPRGEVRPTSEMEGCPLGRQMAEATVVVLDIQKSVRELTDELLV